MELGSKTNVKEKAKVVAELFKKLFKTIAGLVWSFIMLIVECFNWIAYNRMRIPKASLLIELLVFLVPSVLIVLVYTSKARMIEDREGKEVYELMQEYSDSLIKTEVAGWSRGRQEVLDSIKRANEEKSIQTKKITTIRKEETAGITNAATILGDTAVKKGE